VTTYAVYAFKTSPKHERGTIDYWFSSMADQIAEYPTASQAKRKAIAYRNRYWCGVQVAKLTYDDDGNETDEQIVESFTP
jgi:predicted phosphohydrolase